MTETAGRVTVEPPDLGIPRSTHTVDVSIIDTTSTLRGVSTHLCLTPPIKGHDWVACPVYSFLVHHRGLNRSILYDLGTRKDWENLSPPVLSQAKTLGWTFHVQKGVREILEEGGVDANNIEAIIWGHYHFDHTGDPNTFPPSTSLIVGPGFNSMLPGYPTNPDSVILESDLANRELIELDFDTGKSGKPHTYKTLTIGRYRALDYFGDGAFYLLDTPGHATGHISGLARVTCNDPASSFVLLAGDAFYHAGMIRPSKHLPLPEYIIPDPFAPDDPCPCPSEPSHHHGCPGELFDPIFSGRGRLTTEPVYEPARPRKKEEQINDDVDEMLRTGEKLQEFDVHENVFLAAAHDEALLDSVDLFPKGNMNAFVEKDWVKRVRWRFLRDFAKAVGKELEDHGREWGPEAQGERGR